MTNEGAEFGDVLKVAQEKGYAEADPTFDVEGVDTAHKLALMIALCFGTKVDFDDVSTEGISNITPLDIQYAKQFGYKIKLLAIGKADNGKIEARVHPTMVPLHYPLADVDGVFNAVRLVGDFVGPVMQYGHGAGMEATASAVMGDVMSIARGIASGAGQRTPPMAYCADAITKLDVKPMAEICTQYYLRVGVIDAPGVLSKISGILGDHNISIASMIQPEREESGATPIVLMTHVWCEGDVRKAIAEIDQLDVVKEQAQFIRIESAMD